MASLLRMIERVTGMAGIVIAWLVIQLILATCFEVFSRYVLNAPTIWAFELSYMAMGTHALIGAAYTLRERGHIRIDIFYSRFSPKTKALVDTFGYRVLFLPVVSWVSLGLWEYWVEAYVADFRSGQSAWNPIIWPVLQKHVREECVGPAVFLDTVPGRRVCADLRAGKTGISPAET